MRILVTGSCGQLGRSLQAVSVNHPQHTYFFTDVNDLDICDEGQVDDFFGRHDIECVVNCAAYTAVDRAEDEPERCRLLNTTAPGYLAKIAEKHGAAMIQISTDYVFDGKTFRPYTEERETSPISVYGRTKLDGEQLVTAHCQQAMIVRTAWLYSEYGNNFVKTMLRLGREREDLGVVSDQIGTPTYAGDLAEALLTMIDRGVIRGTYHYSNEGVCSWYDFTLAIHRLAAITSCRVRPLHTEEYPTKAVRPYYSVLDKTKIKTTFNLSIPHWLVSLEGCVQRLINE